MSGLFKEVEGVEFDLDDLGEIISDGRYPRPAQDGPLRYYDKTLTCASRGCRSPTHFKLKGIPYCPVGHLIPKMNEMLIELGVAQ